MNQENNPVPVIKFAEEGSGRSISLLSDSASAVYYGFNCRPRQVRYYKVEKSVEEILKGGYTRKDVESFLTKVKSKLEKSKAKVSEYKAKIAGLELSISECDYHQIRDAFRKQKNQVETRMINYEYETVKLYKDAVDALEKFLQD